MVDPLAAGWLTTDEAEALTGYSIAYLRRLATQGRIAARKIGRDWVIYQESLLAYKKRMMRWVWISTTPGARTWWCKDAEGNTMTSKNNYHLRRRTDDRNTGG